MCVHTSQRSGKVFKASKNMGHMFAYRSACVLVSRNTVVERKLDRSSYLKWCLRGPCVQRGMGFNLVFCSILVCYSILFIFLVRIKFQTFTKAVSSISLGNTKV